MPVPEAAVEAAAALSTTGRKDHPPYRDRIRTIIATAMIHIPALYFDPDSIREEYDGLDSDNADWVNQATDAELLQVGEAALVDDELHTFFHECLEQVIDQRRRTRRQAA